MERPGARVQAVVPAAHGSAQGMAKSVPHRGLPTDQRGVLVVQMRLPADTGRFVAGSIQTGI